MNVTIKTKLFGMTIGSVLFLAAVSATGYWGITSVSKGTGEVSSIGVALRNNFAAGIYNDMTRDDINAICTKKDQDQQDAITNLTTHSQLLAQRATAARDAVVDPAIRTMLDAEVEKIGRYVSAANALSQAVVHDRSTAAGPVGQGLQLQTDLQQQLQDNGAQLEQSAKDAERKSISRAAGATRVMFGMCFVSLLLLLFSSVTLVRNVSRSLDRLTHMSRDIAEGEGDVSRRLEVNDSLSSDEIGEVSRFFNLFMDRLQEILRGVVTHTNRLGVASRQLLEASEQITPNAGATAPEASSASRVTQQVSQNLQSLSTGAGEMTLTIQNIATNAHDA